MLFVIVTLFVNIVYFMCVSLLISLNIFRILNVTYIKVVLIQTTTESKLRPGSSFCFAVDCVHHVL